MLALLACTREGQTERVRGERQTDRQTDRGERKVGETGEEETIADGVAALLAETGERQTERGERKLGEAEERERWERQRTIAEGIIACSSRLHSRATRQRRERRKRMGSDKTEEGSALRP